MLDLTLKEWLLYGGLPLVVAFLLTLSWPDLRKRWFPTDAEEFERGRQFAFRWLADGGDPDELWDDVVTDADADDMDFFDRGVLEALRGRR